jgi:hypothetical protein
MSLPSLFLLRTFATILAHGVMFMIVTTSAGQSRLPVSAAESDLPAIPGMSAEQLLVFADYLLQTGEYVRAITEYRRFLLHHPDDARCAMAHFSMGLAWYRWERFADAFHTFQEVAVHYPGTSYGEQAWLWQGESLVRQGHYRAAGTLYAELAQRFHGTVLEEHARYQHAWTLLYQRQWHEAASQLGHITPHSILYTNAQSLAQGAMAGERLPSKSPTLAGILSALLPGSGQLYLGRLGDGLLAFCLNGLFIAGALEATQHHALTVAGLLSFLEVGWYAGTVYGAVNGAYKYNRHTTETFLRNLDNNLHLPVPSPPQARSLGVRFSLGF